MKKRNILIVLSVLMSCYYAGAQEIDQEDLLAESQELRADASVAISKDEFYQGEAKYRKSIALQPENATGKYNLGNAYYDQNKNQEAMKRFLEAAQIATTKEEKHRAFHNLGNTFMNAKLYPEAVEAYKNALRNNPQDDETRYNLALAKEMLEKEEQNNGGGDNDEDQEEKDKENEDKEDPNKDPNKNDQGDQEQEENQDGEKDEEQEGDQQEQQGDPDKPEEQEVEQQQPKQGQLSPQQIESLLEAMNNEEKKVQEKMNAQKQKGAKKKSSKDW